MTVASAMVLLMTPGLAFFYGGMVLRKNMLSTMMQTFLCMSVITLLWVLYGFSLIYGDDIGGVIGDPQKFYFFRKISLQADPSIAPTIPVALASVYHLFFAVITPALISGESNARSKLNQLI